MGDLGHRIQVLLDMLLVVALGIRVVEDNWDHESSEGLMADREHRRWLVALVEDTVVVPHAEVALLLDCEGEGTQYEQARRLALVTRQE